MTEEQVEQQPTMNEVIRHGGRPTAQQYHARLFETPAEPEPEDGGTAA
jgi:hypothetical protein